jgi:hypothetical protein
VKGLGFRVKGEGFCGLGIIALVEGFRVEGLGFRVQVLGSRIQG